MINRDSFFNDNKCLRNRWRLPIMALLFMTGCLSIVGCRSSQPKQAQMVQAKPPTIFGIIYDKSGSVKHNGIIDSLSLRRLARIAANQNGVIAIGTIQEYSFNPLLVYEFKADFEPVQGNLRQMANAITKNKQRSAEMEAIIDSFVIHVMNRISGPRDAPFSDISGAIERFYILFNQPQYSGWRKIMILLSDGQDNITRRFTYVPESEIFTVGWRASEAQARLNRTVIQFENMAACVDYIELQFPELKHK